MGVAEYRALVVDDEPSIRQLTMRALVRRGFNCEPAGDGARALEMVKSTRYDVVVTDLQMPRQHGHSLAMDLLARPDPPLVVVLTGLAEPRLTKDLLARGVDDIVFKPIDFDFLAMKIETLLKRRRESQPSAQRGTCRPTGDAGAPASHSIADSHFSRDEIEAKLAHVHKILPMSQAAFDVFNMTRSDDFETDQIAAAIARDASLSVELLKLANSGFYNASGMKITEMEEVVVRIGRKRIGDLALATSALTALTPNVLPWLAVNVIWQQSIAAGVAADSLVSLGLEEASDDNLFLSAVLYPLGRIVLGTLYPQEYQQMVRECKLHNRTLLQEERRVFAITHGQVLDLLLKSWSIPRVVCEPLRYAMHAYSSLASLPEPLRTRTELLKVAILVGKIAVGEWQPWDCLELPPEALMRRLTAGSLAAVLEQTRTDSKAIIAFRPHRRGQDAGASPANAARSARREANYCNLSPELFDFLPEIVATMGIRLKPCKPEELENHMRVLIGGVWTSPVRLSSLADSPLDGGPRVIVSDADQSESYRRFGNVVTVPASYGALQAACLELFDK